MNSSFNKEKFLLFVLSTIFFFQAAVFGFGLYFCSRNGGLKACPEIRRTYTETFSVQIATVLALLGGGAAVAAKSRDERRPPE